MNRSMPHFDLKARAVERLASLASPTLVPLLHFVAMGKPLRGGTHQRIKAFVIEDGCLVNVTGYLCSALNMVLDTSDLSMVVHRQNIIPYNLALIPGLEAWKDAEISWS